MNKIPIDCVVDSIETESKILDSVEAFYKRHAALPKPKSMEDVTKNLRVLRPKIYD